MITCIENFSNEIFYEIFDYLDGCHIYEAFTNLNYRFQQLLNSPSILFKINIDDSLAQEMSMNQYKPIILLNKQQIFSMELWLPGQGEEFFSSFIIDSMLSHLESFVVKWIDPNVVIPLLVSLTSLPRLFSLTINTWYTLYAFSIDLLIYISNSPSPSPSPLRSLSRQHLTYSNKDHGEIEVVRLLSLIMLILSVTLNVT